MRSLEEWFSEYEKSHKHPTNKKIHYFCVPLILYSVLCLLDLVIVFGIIPLSWLVVILVTPFYLWLNPNIGFTTVATSALMCISFGLFESREFQFWTGITVFVFSWVFQFLGHKIEGKKPSFLQDLLFLLIGPLWVSHFFLQKIRWIKV